MRIINPAASVLSHTHNPEFLIQEAGRVCYRSEGNLSAEASAAFISMLKGRQHESVLEHASATLLMVTDRGISHELVRHRLASYSQESTRYCTYGSTKFGHEIKVICPSFIVGNPMLFPVWEESCKKAEEVYLTLLELGAGAQHARSVLPTCLATTIVMTANFREWRHFLKLRTAKAAHPDMQILAAMVAGKLKEIAPTVFEEF